MSKFTPEFIADQKELAEKATPRPWKNDGYSCFYYEHSIFAAFYTDVKKGFFAKYNIDFILASANNYPAALDEVTRLRAALEQVAGILNELYGETMTDGEAKVGMMINQALKGGEG
jgi:hypothetical protein